MGDVLLLDESLKMLRRRVRKANREKLIWFGKWPGTCIDFSGHGMRSVWVRRSSPCLRNTHSTHTHTHTHTFIQSVIHSCSHTHPFRRRWGSCVLRIDSTVHRVLDIRDVSEHNRVQVYVWWDSSQKSAAKVQLLLFADVCRQFGLPFLEGH
jgi:hypothetical protein